MYKMFTKNSIKFTGPNAYRKADNFISKKRRQGEWWEFAENCQGHAVVMRRRHME